MPGGGSSASTSISRPKRSALIARSPEMILTATTSPDARSRARNTLPMPPTAIGCSSSNRSPGAPITPCVNPATPGDHLFLRSYGAGARGGWSTSMRSTALEDIRGMLRIAELDHAVVERTLAELEAMLDQSDLRPVYARLRAEQASRKVGAKQG